MGKEMNIPLIEIRTTAGIEEIDFEQAQYLRDVDAINFNHYLEKLMQTQWANAWMTFVKGLNGTYAEANDGSLFWEHEDVEYFKTQILGL